MPDYSPYLIVTDLDATFFGTGARLVERNLTAIEHFKAHGGHITAGTGRRFEALRHYTWVHVLNV